MQWKDSVDVDASNDGRIYVIWSEKDDYNVITGKYEHFNVYLAYSSNNGTTFSPRIRVNSEATGNQYHPAIDSDDDNVYVVWEDGSADGNIILSRSEDGGRTFQEIHVSDQEEGTQSYPDIAVNGNNIAVAWEEYRSDNDIRIWNGIDGTFVRRITGHQAAVKDVEYSPTGTRLASGSEDEMVKIWNPGTGALITNLTLHDNYVTSVNWSTDGTRLVTASWDDITTDWDNVTIVWDTSTWSLIKVLNTLDNLPIRNHANRAVFNPNGSKVAVAYNGILGPGVPSGEPTEMFNITRWDVTTNSNCTVNEKCGWHTKSVTDVAFSHDGSLIASCSKDGSVKVWDVTTSAPGGAWPNIVLRDPYRFTNATTIIPTMFNNKATNRIIFNVVDDTGTSPGYRFNVTINNAVRSGIATPPFTNPAIVTFSSGIINPGLDVDVKAEMFYSSNWTLLDDWTGKVDVKEVTSIPVSQAAHTLAWSADDTEIAVGLANGSIAVLNVTGANVKYWMDGTHTGRVNTVSWHPIRYLCSGAADPQAKIWDEPSKTVEHNLPGHTNSVYSADWSSSGGFIATGGGNSQAYQMGESQIFCAVSTDSGLTFSPPVVVTDTCSRIRLRPKMAMDSSDEISLVWYDWRGGDEDVYFANSTDLGVSFSTNIGVSATQGTVENSPDIAVDDEGNVHVIWQYATGQSIRYANSTDGFQNTYELASDGQMPRIAVSPAGSTVWAQWRLNDSSLLTNVSYDGGASFIDTELVTSGPIHGSGVHVNVYNQTSIVWRELEMGYYNISYRGSVLSDTWRPSVVSTVPYDGQVDVSIFTSFSLNFSEPMDRNSVLEAFSWTDGTNTWGSEDCRSISWYGYGDQVSFTPAEPLRYQISSYSMSIDTGATDLAGNPLSSSYTVTFMTGGDTDAPIIRHIPAPSEVNYDQTVDIVAYVHDQWGSVAEVELVYRGVGSTTDITLAMENTNDTQYVATIPAQMALGNVSYYIRAEDVLGNDATLPSNISGPWLNYTVNDWTDPEISHVQSVHWPVHQEIDIWAVVTDEIELVSVEIEYRGVEDVNYIKAQMYPNATAADTFNCTLEAQNETGFFQYSISAIDGSGNVNTTVVYSMEIQDLTKPEIKYVRPEHLANQTEVLVEANVIDDVEVDTVTLFYKAVGGNRWVQREMQPSSEEDLYIFIIPAQRRSGTLHFYVNATDTAGNAASTLEAEQAYEIEVMGVGTDWTPYLILGGILLALIFVLFYQLHRRFGQRSTKGDLKEEQPPNTTGPAEESGEEAKEGVGVDSDETGRPEP